MFVEMGSPTSNSSTSFASYTLPTGRPSPPSKLFSIRQAQLPLDQRKMLNPDPA